MVYQISGAEHGDTKTALAFLTGIVGVTPAGVNPKTSINSALGLVIGISLHVGATGLNFCLA